MVGIALTLASGLYAKEFNWPDYYHVEYVFPTAWTVRTLSTIIGPTDSLTFQPVQFILDLLFWSLVAFLILVALMTIFARAGKKGNQQVPSSIGPYGSSK
jgi:hypothetical protein